MLSRDDCYFLLIIGILLLFYYYEDIESFVIKKRVCNQIDGRCYPTLHSFENNMSASEMLAFLNAFSIKIMRYMRKKYLWDQTGNPKLKYMVKNLLNNYNPDSITENAPKDLKYTSFVEDKGVVFSLCLREKISGKNLIHDKSILQFVVMHEMSHMASDVIGHEDMEFWSNFKVIIQNAEEAGLYTPVDYSQYPTPYCGLKVDYNPYFDPLVPGQ